MIESCGPGNDHRMPGLRGVQTARGRERLDRDDRRARRVVLDRGGGERADAHRDHDDVGGRRELLVELGEDRGVALDHRARDFGVAVPRRVGHDERAIGCELG